MKTFIIFTFTAYLLVYISTAAVITTTLKRTTLGMRLVEFAQADSQHVPFKKTDRPTKQKRLVDNVPVRQHSQDRMSHQIPFQPLPHIDAQQVFYRILFTTEIELGSPPQPFVAGVDIGWSDLFVPSINCTHDPSTAWYCRLRHKYDSTRSSTYVANTTTSEISYLDVTTKGYLSKDTLHIGGLAVTNQIFEEATYWRTFLKPTWSPLDTVLGLARFRLIKARTTMDAKGPLTNMIEQKLLNKNAFALRLARVDSELGELTLGGFDESYSQSLITLPLTNSLEGNNDGFLRYASPGWQVSVNGITFGPTSSGEPLNLALNGSIAIISNSFEYISVPTGMVDLIYKHLGVDNWMEDLPCERRAELPDLTISFGDKGSLHLTPWQYLTEVETNGARCIVPFNNWLQDEEDEHSPNFISLGTAFLSSLYSVFDLDNGTISCKYWPAVNSTSSFQIPKAADLSSCAAKSFMKVLNAESIAPFCQIICS